MNDIISTETMMQGFSNLLDPTAQKIPSVWRKVVSRIKNMEDRKREAQGLISCKALCRSKRSAR